MVTYGENRFRGFDPYANYAREMTATAGLLCLYGFINLVPGVYDLVRATTDGQDWSGDSDFYPPVVLHLAALAQVIFSIVSMAVGFQWLVASGGSRMWTFASALLSLLSFFTFVVAVSYIAFQAAEKNADFIPVQFLPTDKENRSVATLMAIGYMAYAANNFCALVYLNCKMCMLQSEKWTRYNRGSYRASLAFFGFLTLVAGVVQLTLGAYIYDKVDTELLSSPVVGGAFSGPYSISYSEVSMAFAVFQTLLGLFIIWRAIQKPAGDGHNATGMKMFQTFAWFVLIFSISTQVLTQLSMQSTTPLDSQGAAGFASQAVAYVVGLGLFPIYLDAMYYTTPEKVEQGAFSCHAPWAKHAVDEERKVESGPVHAGTVATGSTGTTEGTTATTAPGTTTGPQV